MDSKELTEQGVAALKEGDKGRAQDLLEQAVELDDENAKAWFFLARAQSSVADQRRSLEKVLQIMPDNKPAQEALSKLSIDDFSDVAESFGQVSAPAGKPRSSGGMNFALPIQIPDAPDRVDPQNVISDFIETFKNGIAILQRKPGVYPMEIQRATWWRFWQYIAVGWVISALFSTIANAIVQAQIAAAFNSTYSSVGLGNINVAPPNIFAIIITFILMIPLSIAVMYGGLYISHRWVMTNRNGQGSLVNHAYAIILPTVTAGIIADGIGLILILVPAVGSLASLIISLVLGIYALFIAVDGVTIVHKVDRSSGNWTVGVMFLVQIVIGLVLGMILAPFLLVSGMAFM